jgi:hypothetical protein
MWKYWLGGILIGLGSVAGFLLGIQLGAKILMLIA